MTSDQYDKEGQDHYQRGEYERALEAFRQGLTHFPKDADLQLGCAMAHIQLGDYIQACEMLESLRRTHGHWGDVLQGLTESYLCLGKKAKAIECVEAALASEKDPEFLNALAMILYRHNQFKEASRCYQKATDSNPGYAPAHLGYGVCCHRLGNLKAAVEALRRAISAAPDYWEAYSYLGNLLYDMRKRTESKALLGKIPIEKLWDPAAMKRLLRMCEGKEDKDKRRAVEARQKEVDRILQQSRERGLLDDLSARLDRDLLRKPPPDDSFWVGQCNPPKAGLELDEILKRMFDAPCNFDNGRKPRLVRFDKALCEEYIRSLITFLNAQRKWLDNLGSQGDAGLRRVLEGCDAAGLLFYGSEIIREMRTRFKGRIIEKSLISRLQASLTKFKRYAELNARTMTAWMSAVDALS